MNVPSRLLDIEPAGGRSLSVSPSLYNSDFELFKGTAVGEGGERGRGDTFASDGSLPK